MNGAYKGYRRGACARVSHPFVPMNSRTQRVDDERNGKSCDDVQCLVCGLAEKEHRGGRRVSFKVQNLVNEEIFRMRQKRMKEQMEEAKELSEELKVEILPWEDAVEARIRGRKTEWKAAAKKQSKCTNVYHSGKNFATTQKVLSLIDKLGRKRKQVSEEEISENMETAQQINDGSTARYEFYFLDTLVETVVFDGTVYWRFDHVCKALSITPSACTGILDSPGDLHVPENATISSRANVLQYVTEQGILRLSLRLRNPKCTKFHNWCMEGVHSIRSGNAKGHSLKLERDAQISALNPQGIVTYAIKHMIRVSKDKSFWRFHMCIEETVNVFARQFGPDANDKVVMLKAEVVIDAGIDEILEVLKGKLETWDDSILASRKVDQFRLIDQLSNEDHGIAEIYHVVLQNLAPLNPSIIGKESNLSAILHRVSSQSRDLCVLRKIHRDVGLGVILYHSIPWAGCPLAGSKYVRAKLLNSGFILESKVSSDGTMDNTKTLLTFLYNVDYQNSTSAPKLPGFIVNHILSTKASFLVRVKQRVEAMR